MPFVVVVITMTIKIALWPLDGVGDIGEVGVGDAGVGGETLSFFNAGSGRSSSSEKTPSTSLSSKNDGSGKGATF